MSKHIHYDMIVKWVANPERYRVLVKASDGHYDALLGSPAWNPDCEYKLEEKPNKVVRWIAVWPDGTSTKHYETPEEVEAMLIDGHNAHVISITLEIPYD